MLAAHPGMLRRVPRVRAATSDAFMFYMIKYALPLNGIDALYLHSRFCSRICFC